MRSVDDPAPLPQLALRPDSPDDPERMDDIVAHNVAMFRAEQMDDDNWWVELCFEGDQTVTFDVRSSAKGIDWRVTDDDAPHLTREPGSYGALR